LASTIETRILFCQRSAHKFIDDKGKENPDVSKLFERPWMGDVIKFVLMKQFEGVKLAEFYDLNVDGELEQITEIPKTHFNPKKGIIMKRAGDTTGWN
jgi:hypothetical protein